MTRLVLLEDVNAIRALNLAYARHINTGAHEAIASLFAEPAQVRIDSDIRGLTADRYGDEGVIEVAPGRVSAPASLHCVIETETAIGPSCPLLEMAREQGGGVVRHTERVGFENVYIRRDGIWKIHGSSYRQLP